MCDNDGGKRRGERGSGGSPSPLRTANVTSAQLLGYLMRHGANQWGEADVRGALLFHWAAGCGNLEALEELVAGCDELGSGSRVPGAGTRRRSNEEAAPRNSGAHVALLWKALRDKSTGRSPRGGDGGGGTSYNIPRWGVTS